MQVLDTVKSRDGTTIAFESHGTGPAVILVDAAGGFRGFGPMRPLATALASDFTAYTYDRRGRGESSDTPPYDVGKEIDDLAALIEVAGGIAFVHGFSSGAVLGLHAAAAGLPIRKLSLLEPPIELDETIPSDTELEQEVARLVAAGNRGDAVEHFNRSIGVPEEYLVGMREAPWWPQMERLAHTLVYDSVITRTAPIRKLPSLATPTLVVASEATDESLLGWARALSDELPNAELRTLPGEWHGVAPEVLAPVLSDFYSS